MARHFANHINRVESQRGMPFSDKANVFDAAGVDSPIRVMLIAIRHDPQPPVFHGQHLLQRLQALLAAPGDQSEFNQQSLHARFASGIPAQRFKENALLPPPRLLPPLPTPLPADEQTGFQPRLVRGDILSDSAGQLYERSGRQVRPLHRVVSGPRGEILELISCRPINTAANHGGATANVQAANSQNSAETDSIADSHAGSPDSTAPPTTDSQAHAASARKTPARPAPAPHRVMRPDPRRVRMARFGNDNPPPAERTPNGQRPNPQPQAVQRPTAQQITPERPTAQRVTTERSNHQQSRPAAHQQPQPAPIASVALPVEAVAVGLKTSIPEQWIKQWELRLSRDEAIYDMRLEASAGNSIIGSVRNLKRRLGSRQAFQKWQSLLSGKSLDEQLWGVRPPAGQFSHPQLRDWAQRVLAQAGYEPGVMLPEWEIFWRRKGL